MATASREWMEEKKRPRRHGGERRTTQSSHWSVHRQMCPLSGQMVASLAAWPEPAPLPSPSLEASALSSSPTNSWPPHEAKSKPSGRCPPPSAVQHSLTFLHPNHLAARFELSLSASCLPTSLDCQFHAQRLDQVPSTTRPATGNIERIFGPIIAVSKCLFCGEAIANCRGREAAQGQFNCRPPLLVDFS